MPTHYDFRMTKEKFKRFLKLQRMRFIDRRKLQFINWLGRRIYIMVVQDDYGMYPRIQLEFRWGDSSYRIKNVVWNRESSEWEAL